MGRLSPAARRSGRTLAALAFTGLLSACSQPHAPPKPAPPAAAEASQPSPSPATNPVLTRGDLIAAAAAARDAYARGAPYPAANSELIGRRFSLKLPFGCDADAPGSDSAHVEVDPAQRTLTLEARPQVWTGAPWLAAILGQDPPVEGVEGFWIRRPWITSEFCPSTPAAPGSASASATPQSSPETLAVARIFRTGDSRLKRHARQPYRLVLKLSDRRIPIDHRFWLVLDGRVASLDGGQGRGQPIRCSAETVDTQPACLIGMELDHVALQAQATGDTLADWPG